MTAEQLREQLALLAEHADWPRTPEIAVAVAHRIEHHAHDAVPSGARLRRWVRPAGAAMSRPVRTIAATVAALVLAVAVVPPARSAVLDLLGVTHGERIVRDRRPSAPTTQRRLDLGRTTSLAAARRAVAFELRVPALLGAPSETRISRAIPGAMVSLVYGDRAVLSQFLGGAVPYISKLAGPRTRVRNVRVDGEAGFFVSGASATILVNDHNGRAIAMRSVLDGASVLVWDHDSVAYRLESRGSLAEALTIARSLR